MAEPSPAPQESAKPQHTSGELAELISQQVRSAVMGEIAPLFDDLQRFADRRIAELSAEVHGAVQILDFSEATLSAHLEEIQSQIARLIASPSRATRNSGLELEAVVRATESAANRILDAAESICEWVREGKQDPEAFAVKMETIFEACAFQDLTGQRIRRAIEHLEQVEATLAHMLDRNVPVKVLPRPSHAPGADLNQMDVDILLAD